MQNKQKIAQIIGDGKNTVTVPSTMCGSLLNTQKEIHRVAKRLNLRAKTRSAPGVIICWFENYSYPGPCEDK